MNVYFEKECLALIVPKFREKILWEEIVFFTDRTKRLPKDRDKLLVWLVKKQFIEKVLQ